MRMCAFLFILFVHICALCPGCAHRKETSKNSDGANLTDVRISNEARVPPTWGLKRYVHSRTNVRAERTTSSSIVGKLEAGDSIKADFYQNNWYAVFKSDTTGRSESLAIGYVYAPLLRVYPPKKKSISTPGPSAPPSTSYEVVGPIRDLSYLNVKRVSASIVIPPGRSREIVIATLERAARELGESARAKAASINAYRNREEAKGGPYTIGRAIYAPNGKWEEAHTGQQMRVSVVLGELYFSPKPDRLEPSDVVVLTSKDGDRIALSSKWDIWEEAYIIGYIRPGTRATVIRCHTSALTASIELVRYLIRVDEGGQVLTGWVFDGDVAAVGSRGAK